MKKVILWTLILLIAICTASSFLFAQEKLAQTGFQFLSVGTAGRASAMGEAATTIEVASTTLIYNPAGLARMTNFLDVSASWNNWIADIKQNSFTLALSPQQGRYGVFGLSFLWVDYGEFLGRSFDKNTPNYRH
jgi:hypothetical protein